MSQEVCGCFYNPANGYFEACCEQHEWDYVAYLESIKKASELGWNDDTTADA